MVCDSWLALEFPIIDTGQILLMRATKLRQKWDYLLNLQLQSKKLLSTILIKYIIFLHFLQIIVKKNLVLDLSENTDANPADIEEELCYELTDFMNTSIPYSIKRLLPADLKSIYVFEGNGELIDPNPFDPEFQCVPHEKKGGVRLTKSITYNW